MCLCKNIIPQSQKCYDQMAILKVPKNLDIRMNAPDREKKEWVSVDPCLAEEILSLWKLGIVTTGCCCGHNITDSEKYIGVEDKYIPKMKLLGYKVCLNSCRPKDEDSFMPKSKLLNL